MCGIIFQWTLHHRGTKTQSVPTFDIAGDKDDAVTEATDNGRPTVATLMSDSRSLDGVCYFLNEERVKSLLDRNTVFEAMMLDPNVKGPTLAFWTDDPTHKYGDLSFFPVELGTDLRPRNLAVQDVPQGHIMVVRYLARMRSTIDRTYYLENPALLGYAYMSIDQATQLSRTPPAELPQEAAPISHNEDVPE